MTFSCQLWRTSLAASLAVSSLLFSFSLSFPSSSSSLSPSPPRRTPGFCSGLFFCPAEGFPLPFGHFSPNRLGGGHNLFPSRRGRRGHIDDGSFIERRVGRRLQETFIEGRAAAAALIDISSLSSSDHSSRSSRGNSISSRSTDEGANSSSSGESLNTSSSSGSNRDGGNSSSSASTSARGVGEDLRAIGLEKLRVTCEEGKTFDIQSVEELQGLLLEELPCIFAAGITPPVVPLGAMYGTILYPKLPGWVNSLIYQGHYSTQTVCNGEVVHLDQMSSLGVKPTTAFVRIGIPAGQFQNDEYFDGRESVVVDLDGHFKEECWERRGGIDERLTNIFFAPYKDRQLPIGISFNDLYRIVGVDTNDGGTILLERSLVRDSADPNNNWVTVAYVARKNFDPRLLSVRTSPARTDPITIGPIASTFTTPFATSSIVALSRYISSVLLYPLS